MLTVFIIFLLIALIAILYEVLTVKINNKDTIARDKSSEIDTCLWDRAYQLSKLLEMLEQNGIKADIEPENVDAFALGMPPVMQAATAKTLDDKDEKLRAVVNGLPKGHKLLSDNEFLDHIDKFNDARNELIKATINYNKSINAYNNFISGFPVSVIANFHKKRDKASFVYYFRELGEIEEKTL